MKPASVVLLPSSSTYVKVTAERWCDDAQGEIFWVRNALGGSHCATGESDKVR